MDVRGDFMRIAIVEDDAQQQEKLSKYITKCAAENQVTIQIECFSDGIQIVDNYDSGFDVIYFDIEMALMDGMTAAKKIRQIDTDVIIVFITNHVQFAVEGYSVNAADFLLKPLSYFSFSEHFKKVKKSFDTKSNRSLSFKTPQGFRKINLDELLYAESQGHYIHLHLSDETLSIWDTMKNLEKKLLPFDFFRCNNGYLVNLKLVKGIENNHVLIGNEKLLISRPRKKEFLSVLTNYLGD